MVDRFAYDVFLSHNAKDKPRVRGLAEELRAAGLRVWFDEWVLRPGDDIYLAIEWGLEAARAQVLCLSPAALGSEWVTLERSTVLFRDPTNAGRRFIPLLLADCELPDALRRYKYVDYRRKSKAAFAELLAACRSETEAVPPALKVKTANMPAQPPEQVEPRAVRYVGMVPSEQKLATARKIRNRHGEDSGARISSRPSQAMPPQHPDRIDLEFWAEIDLGPLERAFAQEFIGQPAVKRGTLESLRSYSARCRELLMRNPAAVKTAADEEYRLPVFSLFGAAGMGKTSFCRVMAQHLFGGDEFTSIIDLSGKLLGTQTLGVAPPYVGWDQESSLIRFARESRGLGLVCFDEFVRLQRFNQEPLAQALSPLLELLQSRSFVPASPHFVPPGRRYHMANTVFVFSSNVSPGKSAPEGFEPIEALFPLARCLAESGSIFYFEPLRDEDFHSAIAITLRDGARRWAIDFMPDLAGLAAAAAIEEEFLEQLSANIRESVRRSGGQPSLTFVRGQVARLHYERSFDALARHDGRLILGRELLDLETGP